MTQEQAAKIMAAVMGKCWHEPDEDKSNLVHNVCKICGFEAPTYYGCQKPKITDSNQPKIWHPEYADHKGRMIGEVIDFMQKELPEWWNAFLVKMTRRYYWEDVSGTKYLTTELFNAQLSLTNLAKYIKDHYKKMFYQECPQCEGKKYFTQGDIYPHSVPCSKCGGTGRIPIPRFERAIKVIEETEKEKAA